MFADVLLFCFALVFATSAIQISFAQKRGAVQLPRLPRNRRPRHPRKSPRRAPSSLNRCQSQEPAQREAAAGQRKRKGRALRHDRSRAGGDASPDHRRRQTAEVHALLPDGCPSSAATDKIEAEMFYVAYTLDGQDAAKRPLTFAFNGGPGSASIWLHMGALGSAQGRAAAGWLHASRALPHGRQSLHAARQERPGADRRDWHRLQPRRGRRAVQEILGSEGRHRSLQRIHSALHHAQRALVVAAVSVRRKLRNDALGRHRRIPGRPRHFVQRHHAAVDRAELRNARRQQHQRSALHFSDSIVHHDRGLSPQAGARSRAGHEPRAAGIGTMGFDRIRTGTGQGRRAHARRSGRK